MSETRRYNRAECSPYLRRKAAEFVMSEKSRQGIKTAILAQRLGRAVNKQVYNDISRIQSGDLDGVGFDYLLRLVEAVGFTAEITFKPKVTEASRRVAA